MLRSPQSDSELTELMGESRTAAIEIPPHHVWAQIHQQGVASCWRDTILETLEGRGGDVVIGKLILQQCEYSDHEVEVACLKLCAKDRAKEAAQCAMNLHLQLRAVRNTDALMLLISEVTAERDEGKTKIHALEARVRELEKGCKNE